MLRKRALAALRRQRAEARANARSSAATTPSPACSPTRSTGSVTSPFGYRIHPIYHYWGLHDGTDFGVACGEAACAPPPTARCISRYYSDVYGNRLYLDVGKVNGKDMTVVYNHATSYRVGRRRPRRPAARSSATSARPAGPPAATCTSPCCRTAPPWTR